MMRTVEELVLGSFNLVLVCIGLAFLTGMMTMGMIIVALDRRRWSRRYRPQRYVDPS